MRARPGKIAGHGRSTTRLVPRASRAGRRYFVLTRKGLHYYVRKQDDTSARRDLFGEHEGSIALGNIARVETHDEKALTFIIASKAGGRKFVLRAGTPELYTRWLTTLQRC